MRKLGVIVFMYHTYYKLYAPRIVNYDLQCTVHIVGMCNIFILHYFNTIDE